ncbi:MAG: sugar phosphate isomerase/epimerase [Thermoguttaceae bacterium]|jgi:hexulose-6-phosphate isomerase|nr:sugar phosphate isomerase/epimerase [Thermoguttaceae bacterium]
MTRRGFLAASAVAGAGLMAGRIEAAPFQTKLQKAMIAKPTEKILREHKEAGFDGLETSDWNVSPDDAEQARKRAEQLGMKIHSVLFGWANFNHEDKLAADLANVEKALKATAAYGASALLLVPCRVGGMAIPEAWEFDIEFDERTGHVTRVVAGDNAKYRAYIEAQNHATDVSRRAVEKLIPTAEKTGVIIALENVWNNLWVKPALFAHFVKSFNNRWVQTYFDIGNHVKYAPAEEWIRALGKTIVKFHVKDFKLNPDGHGGKFVHPRDGSVNWPLVREEIEKIGYNGFLTIEDGGLPLKEFSHRLDLIIAGK